ncbi:MAG: 3-oxoacid CoA-transferase subunit B [Clostridia bacterium]|nr:3-oxoacid CoA-transferase subunit B [Clostridia bacterium]
MDKKEIIARRVSKELKNGDVVNLGIGTPTLAANYVPEGVTVIFQSENGMLGIGPAPTSDNADDTYTNAGGALITAIPGASVFDNTMSFAVIRSGRVKTAVLGALEVDEFGSIANWMIPGKSVNGMGGAMDLVVGAKRIIVAMEHTVKGRPKILKKCTLPLTAAREVDMIITDLCVIDVDHEHGLTLTELAPGVSIEDVKAATQAPIKVSPELKTMELF